MKVIIVGCGRVGSTIARELSTRGNDVIVIDRRAEAFRRLRDNFPGRTITGIGFDREVLLEAGVDPECAVIAVTNGDNSNILIARVARELFRVEKVVARIYDPRRAAIYARLGIPTVASVTWASERILKLIASETSAPEWLDPSSRFEVRECRPTDDMVGLTVAQFENLGRRILLVVRNGHTSQPDQQLVIQDGDVLYEFAENVSGSMSMSTQGEPE